MVLADLFAADEPDAEPEQVPAVSHPAGSADKAGEAQRLTVTTAQLEHALAARVRVEQAIGVLRQA